MGDGMEVGIDPLTPLNLRFQRCSTHGTLKIGCGMSEKWGVPILTTPGGHFEPVFVRPSCKTCYHPYTQNPASKHPAPVDSCVVFGV